jgi:hypothetical protein
LRVAASGWTGWCSVNQSLPPRRTSPLQDGQPPGRKQSQLVLNTSGSGSNSIAIGLTSFPGSSSSSPFVTRRSSYERPADSIMSRWSRNTMKKIRIRELPNWPPGPGGATLSSYRIPTSEQAKVTRVEPKQANRWVTFVGQFEGHDHSYDFEASSEKLAETIREVLRNHLGTSVYGLGDLEVELEPEGRVA